MKRAGVSVFFSNKEGEMLIVKPTYRDGWLPVGGTIDENESPKVAIQREVKEELGIILEHSNFEIISICYVSSKGGRTEAFQFSFWGGILSTEQISQIKLPCDELEEFRFVSVGEAKTLLSPGLGKNLDLYFEAMRNKKIIYLEA